MYKFFNILINLSSFFYGSYNRSKIIISQDHIRGFFSYIGPGNTHSYPDIRFFSGWSIIYPVPGHRYHVLLLLQGTNDTTFMTWRYPGKDSSISYRLFLSLIHISEP